MDPTSPAAWAQAFAVDLSGARLNVEEGPTGYYRPLAVCSFLLDRALGGAGGAAAVGHLQSALWQALAIGALHRLLLRLRIGPAARALGLVIFALHPLQVEPVAWLSARNDLMVSVFVLSALALTAGGPGPAPRAQAAGAFALALAGAWSKELGLIAPLALALAGAPARATAASAAGVAAALALRWGVGVQPLPVSAAAIRAVIGEVAAISARDLLWPLGLHPGERLGWSPPAPLGPLAGALGLAALLAALGRGRARFGLLLAGIAWAPSLAAVAQLGLVGLRYHHLSLAGLGLAAAAAADRRLGERPTRVLALGIGVLGVILSQGALAGWRDDGAFWDAAVARHPNPYTWTGRGHLRREQGQLDGAAEDLRRATTGPQISPLACFGVASLELRRAGPGAAAEAGLRALSAGCAPSPELLGPTAVGLAATGRWDEARPLAAALRGAGPDPTGLGVVLQVALEARERQRRALDAAGAPAGLVTQAAYLLEQGGDAESAAWLRPGGG